MRYTERTFRWYPLVATLSLGLALSGCSREEIPSAPTGVEAVQPEGGDASSGGALNLRDASLTVTTADPDQYYVVNDPDPWFFRSTVTNAEFFDLIVRNDTRRTATNVELLVTVPGNLGPGGWMVLIDGVFFSSIEDFPYTGLENSYYPRVPHFIYQPQGNAHYQTIAGPASLAPGEEWVLPVQLSRGVAENFKVHFVAASANRLWTSPLRDVTAQPPVNNNGGGGERPGPGGNGEGLGGR